MATTRYKRKKKTAPHQTRYCITLIQLSTIHVYPACGHEQRVSGFFMMPGLRCSGTPQKIALYLPRPWSNICVRYHQNVACLALRTYLHIVESNGLWRYGQRDANELPTNVWGDIFVGSCCCTSPGHGALTMIFDNILPRPNAVCPVGPFHAGVEHVPHYVCYSCANEGVSE